VRVLVNCNALAPVGGLELSSLQVCRELVGRGHELDLLYRDGGELEPQWRALTKTARQVPSFLVEKQRPIRDLRAILPAVRAAAGLRPDVVWLNRAEHLVWGLLASRVARAPLVCHLRTHPHFPAVRWLSLGVSRFIAISAYVRDIWVDAGVPPGIIEVVRNGVDPTDYPEGGHDELIEARRRLGLSPEAYVVLYYGRIHPQKGIDLLFEAWRRLALPAAEGTLLLAGDPYPTPEGQEYARQVRLNAPPGVRLVGMRGDVVPLLHAADTIVLPAQWQEPFGRVVAEGLMSGRPVIASRVGGIPEQLTGELSAFLFDPSDAAELASRLGALRHWRRDDPGLGPRCAENARTRLSLHATVNGVEDILTSVARRPAAPRGRPTARLRQRGTPTRLGAGAERLTAAVVICAYTMRRWELLRQAVASVRAQSVQPRQIVLVVDHNEELLRRCLQEWPADGQQLVPPVEVVANRFDGRLGSARNTGVELLTTDVVAFLDDDAAADPTWLETLLAAYHEDGDAVAVGGSPRPRYVTGRPAWFPQEFNWVYGCHYAGLPNERAPVRHVIGAAMSARVDALRKIGGFHSDNHDDMDMCHRLAAEFGPASVLYEPRATVRHTVTADRVTWSYFWRRCFFVNRGKVLAFADMGPAGNLTAELRFAGQSAASAGRRMARGLTGDLPALPQAGAILVGLVMAGAGHLVGKVELRLGRTAPSLTRGLP
jgi:glycosyltransferase involved in cell wall biosynthesis/GT2 family glycosyltransferase